MAGTRKTQLGHARLHARVTTEEGLLIVWVSQSIGQSQSVDEYYYLLNSGLQEQGSKSYVASYQTDGQLVIPRMFSRKLRQWRWFEKVFFCRQFPIYGIWCHYYISLWIIVLSLVEIICFNTKIYQCTSSNATAYSSMCKESMAITCCRPCTNYFAQCLSLPFFYKSSQKSQPVLYSVENQSVYWESPRALIQL